MVDIKDYEDVTSTFIAWREMMSLRQRSRASRGRHLSWFLDGSEGMNMFLRCIKADTRNTEYNIKYFVLTWHRSGDPICHLRIYRHFCH